MELTKFQEKTKNHVLEVFRRKNNSKKKYLIADEVGLGKTIIAAEIIKELASDKIDEPYIVYYICGNERVTSQNCTKLREICGGIKVEDVRLSMQLSNANAYKNNASNEKKDPKKLGVIILPLTPATTFTNKNSEFNLEEANYYINISQGIKFKEETKKNYLGYLEKMSDFIRTIKKDGNTKNIYVQDDVKKAFLEFRTKIVEYLIEKGLKPDLVLLDEFQNYPDLLHGGNKLFEKCMEGAEYVLLLSATPYEMSGSEVKKMSPFDDGLGKLNKDDEEEEEDNSFNQKENPEAKKLSSPKGNPNKTVKYNEEDNGKDKKNNENFKRLVGFIDPSCNKENDPECKKSNDEQYLYDNVFCRTERSMFYNWDKENEVNYVYCNVQHECDHLEYTADLYSAYEQIYRNAEIFNENFPGNPSDAFISYVKESPAPASFSTRYKSLKNTRTDTNFYKDIKNCDDLFIDNENTKLNYWKHAGLSLLRDKACPDGIEKLLWIPPSYFDCDENGIDNKNNPFIQFKDYTKSLVFGNYRFSTAAPSLLLSRYIYGKRKKLIDNWKFEKITDSDLCSYFDNNHDLWPYSDKNKTGTYIEALNALKKLICVYLSQNIDLIMAVTKERDPYAAVDKYTKWGDLKNVIKEYVYILGLDTANEQKLNDLKSIFVSMTIYYNSADNDRKIQPTKVICFKSGVEAEGDDELRGKCQESCGFAERFTDDNTDRGAHIKSHQQLLQNLFNSPFYPFVITTTSVAQEGLDFHNYCHRIVHWSVAKTPIAYEQREGRIDRYLSHLMRKRIVMSAINQNNKLCDFKDCIELLKGKIGNKINGKPLFPYWYVGEEEYKAINEGEIPHNWPKFIRVICALPNSRESRYFSQLRAALKNYNYYLGPTYQPNTNTSHNFCPLCREQTEDKNNSLNTFLTQSNSAGLKLLVCNQKSVGNALIRQYNRWQKKPVWNAKTVTVSELAKEFLKAVAYDENGSSPEMISDDSVDYIVMSLLKNGKFDTFKKDSITLATSKELRLALNEIRLNGWNKDETLIGQKLVDVETLRQKLEEELVEENKFDYVRMLDLAIEKLNKMETERLHLLLPWTNGLLMGDLETNRWSEKEREFLSVLARKASNGGRECEVLSFLSEPEKKNYSFHKSYGIANEVRFVGTQIVDMDKQVAKIPFSDVAIYYSSPQYLNHIKGTFDVMHIPYEVIAKTSAGELNICKFMISVLDAARNDYLYSRLEEAVINRVVTFYNVADETVKINPPHAYRKALNAGIGWGRERYKDYVKRVSANNESTEEDKIFAGMLEDFINIFESDSSANVYSISEMLRRLWEFTRKYTYQSNTEKMVFKGVITDKIAELAMLDPGFFSDHQSKLDFLYDILTKLTVDSESDSTAVQVKAINGFFVMERKYNFIIGLSATDFALDDKQSPVLLDQEKLSLLNGAGEETSSVDIASERNKRRRDYLNKSLSTLALQEENDPLVSFSYSYYDTQNLRQSASSVFFIECCNDAEVDETPGFENWENYISEDFRIDRNDLEEAVRKKSEKIKKEIEEKRARREGKAPEVSDNDGDELTPDELENLQNEEISKEEKYENSLEEQTKKAQENCKNIKSDEGLSISASGIQTMLGCPLRYYYQYVKYLRTEDQLELQGHQWLTPIKRGNLYHYFMEEYMQKVMPPNAALPSEIDEAAFDSCYEKAISKVLQEVPYPSKAIYERDKAYYKKLIRNYVKYMHRKWVEDDKSGKNWKVIGCELLFGKNGGVEAKYQKSDYTLLFNGSVDRADGYVDNDGILKIRIIDYKTGQKKSKNEEIEQEKQIQHVLYAFVLKNYYESDAGHKKLKDEIFKEDLNRLSTDDFKGIEFEWVGYTFPYEEEENYLLDCTSKIYVEEDGNKVIDFSKNVRSQLDSIIGNTYNERWDVLQKEFDNVINYKINFNHKELKAFCDGNHCNFKTICRKCIGTVAEEVEEE